MSTKNLEDVSESVVETMKENTEVVRENDYSSYRKLGGIINKNDYTSAIARMKDVSVADEYSSVQAGIVARVASISLDKNDPITILYGILRDDRKPEGGGHHHSEMSDQNIFVEALRMLGDEESVKKVVAAYPHISFSYTE